MVEVRRFGAGETKSQNQWTDVNMPGKIERAPRSEPLAFACSTYLSTAWMKM